MSDVAAPASAAPAPSSTPAAPTASASTPASSAPSTTPGSSAAPSAKKEALPPPNSKHADKSEAGADAAPPNETAAEKKERLKYKFQGKVFGKDIDEELEEEQLKVRLQKGYAFDVHAQEKADLEKKVTAIFQQLKENPFEALKDPVFGLDLEALAEEHLAKKYRAEMEEAQLTAEQKEAKRLKTELEQLKKAEADRVAKEKAARDAAEAEERDKKVFAETEEHMLKALELSGMPKNYETLYEFARIAKLNLEKKIGLTPEQLAAEVKAAHSGSHERWQKSTLSTKKGEDLLAYLGDELVNEVIKTKLAKVRGATPEPFKAPEPKVPAGLDDGDDEPGAKRRMTSLKEFRKFSRG